MKFQKLDDNHDVHIKVDKGNVIVTIKCKISEKTQKIKNKSQFKCACGQSIMLNVN